MIGLLMYLIILLFFLVIIKVFWICLIFNFNVFGVVVFFGEKLIFLSVIIWSKFCMIIFFNIIKIFF